MYIKYIPSRKNNNTEPTNSITMITKHRKRQNLLPSLSNSQTVQSNLVNVNKLQNNSVPNQHANSSINLRVAS